MAHSLPNDRRLVGKARHSKLTMHHLCNQMDDDSSSCCERTGSKQATPAVATARSLSGDERLCPMDFSSTHESRPNNLVSGCVFTCHFKIVFLHCYCNRPMCILAPAKRPARASWCRVTNGLKNNVDMIWYLGSSISWHSSCDKDPKMKIVEKTRWCLQLCHTGFHIIVIFMSFILTLFILYASVSEYVNNTPSVIAAWQALYRHSISPLIFITTSSFYVGQLLLLFLYRVDTWWSVVIVTKCWLLIRYEYLLYKIWAVNSNIIVVTTLSAR